MVNDLIRMVADELHQFERRCIQEAIRLMENDNTIPFIARYRRAQTGGMDAGQLRELKTIYDNLRAVRSKVVRIIEKEGAAIPQAVQVSLFQARTLEEVNDLYAPFKKGGKGTLAERARSNGLEEPAKQILDSPNSFVNLNKYVKADVDGLKTTLDVKNGIQHIIAEIMAKDDELTSFVNKCLEGQISIEAKTSEAKMKNDKNGKFADYYEFRMNTQFMKSHQVLAINRGEEQKVLITKIFMSDRAKYGILNWLKRKWISNDVSGFNRNILVDAVDDSFKRLIEKKFLKRIRTRLTATAEREAVEIFSRNLQRLLLAPPVRGKNTLALDPGFRHGCKLAALDKHGKLLDTAVVYLMGDKTKAAEHRIIELVKQHRCEIIALGNGTACRESESVIANMIKRGMFKPLDVRYCIVNESGASVWSVTKEAQAEFPNLDPNLVSAVSIGRRLQDPLLELVKIEPKHIGVGMYQHDISGVLLKAALEGVLENCVSFVGVDLNACTAAILRRIAGLGTKKAEAIIEWRDKNGPFINRKQLLSVKGFGQKLFEQCAGFVRISASGDSKSEMNYYKGQPQDKTGLGRKRKSEIESKTSSKKRRLDEEKFMPEPLDQTNIHPESYSVTYKLLRDIHADVGMIGTPKIAQILDEMLNTRMNELLETLKVDEETLRLISQGLKQPLGYDLRSEMEEQLFKCELRSFDDLTVGETVTGVVANVTSFGVFVDFGVGNDGLIHNSRLNGCKDLGPGDKCECYVASLDLPRQRIGLEFKCRKSRIPVLR